VWDDDRNGNWDIYGYNLSTREEFRVTKDEGIQIQPAVSDSYIVWLDRDCKEGSYDPLDDIYGFNLKTSEEFRVTTNDNDAELPAIYGDIVVWMDFKGGNSDIYGCDLSELPNTEEKPSTGNEEKKGMGNEDENGICLGTFFVALILLWGIYQIQKPIE
jgi:beta propeller repeat protein